MDVHDSTGKPLHDGDPAHYYGTKAVKALTQRERVGRLPELRSSRRAADALPRRPHLRFLYRGADAA